MTEERLKLWLEFAKFALGTFILGLVTTFVNNAIQEREIELKEQEQVGQFLQHALQEDVGVRRRFAQYFSTVTRSDKLRNGWSKYYDLVNTEFTEKENEKKQLEKDVEKQGLGVEDKARLDARIAELEQALSPKPLIMQTDIEPRVYFHIRSDQQRDAAKRIAGVLSENSFSVPGIQRLDYSKFDTSQLRYFRNREKNEAETIATLIKNSGIPIDVTYISGYELSTKIRPRHYEVWFSDSSLNPKLKN